MKFITGCLLLLAVGCATPPPATVRFHEQVNETVPEHLARVVDVPSVRLRIKVDKHPSLTEREVNHAEVQDTVSGAVVVLKLGFHGAALLEEVTTRCRSKYLVTFVDDRPVSVWLVDKRLTNGEFTIEGDLSDEQAHQLVESLNHMIKGRDRY